jgi:hypothetical protein
MLQILKSPWFAYLHALRISFTEIAFNHLPIFLGVENSAVGAGQGAEETTDTSFIIDGNDPRLRIFMDRSGRADMETVGVIALKADNRPVIGLFEILDRPDSGASLILSSGFDFGAGLFAIETVIAFLRIDG